MNHRNKAPSVLFCSPGFLVNGRIGQAVSRRGLNVLQRQVFRSLLDLPTTSIQINNMQPAGKRIGGNAFLSTMFVYGVESRFVDG